MKTSPSLGIRKPQILLPNPSIDLSKWAVVACDQYTSQKDYWKRVEDLVGEAPSTYYLILPEAYLGTEKEKQHASHVFPFMQKYLTDGIFQKKDGFILVARQFADTTRLGLMVALDLEAYDFRPNAKSLIRATEGTIVDRLPPRIAIREKAAIEIPHILVLIDDPEQTVIQPLRNQVNARDQLYDFELMQGGGHISGYLIDPDLDKHIIESLERLRSPRVQSQKYAVEQDAPPLLFAMGDGNHSLATAKSIWEKDKHNLPSDHPSRFALVELVNLHDESLEFEAIHRLLLGVQTDLKSTIYAFFQGKIEINQNKDFKSLTEVVDAQAHNEQIFGLIENDHFFTIRITERPHTLTVGSVQPWLDWLLKRKAIEGIDYIHGVETIHSLAEKNRNAGVYLPAMPKSALFRSVIHDGPLPRKTFSMGEAHQKRYYLECRKIK